MNDRQRRARRAQTIDQQDRAHERGPGRRGGPAWFNAEPHQPRPTGTTSAAILRRLRRDYPELHRLVLDGQVTPFGAAVAAGFRKRPGRQPKPPIPFTADITRLQEMELWLGNGSAFTSNEQRRALWAEHRERLMRLWGQDGRRPQAWWAYESPIPYPGYDRERSTLYAAGLLGEQETEKLVAYWREEFDRTWQPGFFFCNGPDDFLEGPAARRKHFAWADIPPTLVRQWTSQHNAARLNRHAT